MKTILARQISLFVTVSDGVMAIEIFQDEEFCGGRKNG